MTTPVSSVLLVSTNPNTSLNLGVDVASPRKILANPSTLRHGVFIVDCASLSQNEISALAASLENHHAPKRAIYLLDKVDSYTIKLINNLSTFSIIESSKAMGMLETQVREALLSLRNEYQDNEAVKILSEQNEKLKGLKSSLKENLHSISVSMEMSLKRQQKISLKMERLHQALLTIYQAESVQEIETAVIRGLKGYIELQLVRVVFQNQSSVMEQIVKDKNIYTCTLDQGFQELGHVIFVKAGQDLFKADEKKFLNEISEAISLSLDRIIFFEKSRTLQDQWQTAFNAFSDLICIVDENFNLIQTNLKKNKGGLGKCHKVLFKRDNPCDGCKMGRPFQLQTDKDQEASRIYNVLSQHVADEPVKQYIHVYQDTTEQLRMQRQLMESAKMAELGTIGSSIAHELNNPLGGMINFLQLTKMDLDGKENFFPDILEMEKAAIRCKNIVKNLLGFSRNAISDNWNEIDITEVVDQAIQITELKTRSLGIDIKVLNKSGDFVVNGRFNYLAHAIRNLLQNSQEAIVEKRLIRPDFKGEIKVNLFNSGNKIVLEILDNGIGIESSNLDRVYSALYTTKASKKHSGLGLTLAQKIFQEHKSTSSITSQKNKGTCVAIRFSKAFGEV